MNLYVGNLSFETIEAELETAFVAFGQVESVTIIRDRLSGDSRGFGFVDMPNHAEALAAISGLVSTELHGRTITVNEARPRNDSRRGDGRNRGSRGSW